MTVRAIDRTTQLFVTSIKEALPNVRVNVQRSFAKHGRSNYVYLHLEGRWRPLKVRISDHPVGMRRALYGDENLFIHHLAKPASWAVWMSRLASHDGQSPEGK
jgi:hypothetical protein